jgi:hypothetical protein
MHDFELQHSTQSLRDGFAEYALKNPALLRGDRLSGEAREFFRCHDAAHVVFGCGTSLSDETVVKLSSIFGTSAGLSVLRGYRLHESIDIYKRLAVRDVLRACAAAIVVVPRTIVRCLRQRKRWPWSDFDAELDVPLAQIRSTYGIVVPRQRRSPGASGSPGSASVPAASSAERPT